jgi:hypothetical protein
MGKLRSRVAATVMVGACLSGGFVGTAPAAGAAEGEQAFDLQVEVVCEGTLAGEAVSIAGTVRTTGVMPAQVAVGELFHITGEVSAHLDTDLPVEPERAFYRTRNAQLDQMDHQFPDTSLDLFVRAGLTPGPLELGYDAPTVLWARVTRPDIGYSARVECRPTGGAPTVTIADVLPADGSLALFDLTAVGSCIRSDGEVPTPPIRLRLHGVAPTRVAPGQAPTVVADYEGYGEGPGENVWMTVTGDGGWRVMSFKAYSNSRVVLPTPKAGAGGAITFRFWQMTAWRSDKFNPYGTTVWCTFGPAAPALRIPVSG